MKTATKGLIYLSDYNGYGPMYVKIELSDNDLNRIMYAMTTAKLNGFISITIPALGYEFLDDDMQPMPEDWTIDEDGLVFVVHKDYFYLHGQGELAYDQIDSELIFLSELEDDSEQQ